MWGRRKEDGRWKNYKRKSLVALDEIRKYPIRANHYDEKNGKLDFVLGIEALMDYIESLPTIEAEPAKHGRWLKTGQSFIFPEKFRNYFCSECGFELDKSIRTDYHYCPNCGARMDGRREDGR